jgi:hypothetical protein
VDLHLALGPAPDRPALTVHERLLYSAADNPVLPVQALLLACLMQRGGVCVKQRRCARTGSWLHCVPSVLVLPATCFA